MTSQHVYIYVALTIALVVFIILFAVYYSQWHNLSVWDRKKRIVSYANYNFYNRSRVYNASRDFRVVILLTCTAYPNSAVLKQRKPSERIRTYETSIKKWLEQGSFPIVVVDNSNYVYTLRHENLEQLPLDEHTDPMSAYVRNKSDKGEHESNAIRYALQHSKFLQRARYIVKITGRFFVPDLGLALQNVENYNVIRQNDTNKCQIVGCRYTDCDYIFEPFIVYKSNIKSAELHYKWKIDGYPKDKVLQLPVLSIPATMEGGNGRVITSL